MQSRKYFLALMVCALSSCHGASKKTTVNLSDTTLSAIVPQKQTTAIAASAPNENVQPTKISQDFTGTFVDMSSRREEEAPVDGRMQICPDGIGTYTVFDNQLVYTFTLRQVETGAHQAHLEFYFDGADHGRDFANTDLQEPPQGTLVATSELTAEYVMSFNYKAKGFIEAVRKSSPHEAEHHVFPKAFFFAMRVTSGAADCNTIRR